MVQDVAEQQPAARSSKRDVQQDRMSNGECAAQAGCLQFA
jgi:hypothetical protein